MCDGEIIQGLWVGPALSVMERLSIASFLAHGHAYHLYAYEDVKGLPAGAVLKDAGAILPASMVFEYRDFKSYAGFSNFFRYKLLLEKGGWWADADMVCLKPFDFPAPYVFSSELGRGGEQVVNAGVIKAPAGSPAMAYAWETCAAKETARIVWGETGPRLVGEAVRKFSLGRHVEPPEVFCPLPLVAFEKLVEPGASWAFGEATRAVHLWHEAWRRVGLDKEQAYHPDCLYEQLKRRFL
jgi:Glycosyltransferase sugar-binding region containing DXD motif